MSAWISLPVSNVQLSILTSHFSSPMSIDVLKGIAPFVLYDGRDFWFDDYRREPVCGLCILKRSLWNPGPCCIKRERLKPYLARRTIIWQAKIAIGRILKAGIGNDRVTIVAQGLPLLPAHHRLVGLVKATGETVLRPENLTGHRPDEIAGWP